MLQYALCANLSHVIRFGKPDAGIFEIARERFCPEVPKDKVLMIGDTVRTDILGANRAGIKSCLVLEGGITEYELTQRACSLAEYLAGETGTPDYVVPKVCQKPLF